MHVLFVGRTQIPTINIVAGHLRSRDSDLKIDVLDPFLPSREPIDAAAVQLYDRVLQSPAVDFAAAGPVRKAWHALRAAATAPGALTRRCRTDGFAGAKQQLYVTAASNMRRAWCRAAFAGYDAIHIHGLFEDAFPQFFADNFADGQRVVVSFWGSDLFRHAGVESYRHQFQILQRADVVTVTSPEMREVVLSKFGRDLEGKLRPVTFGLPDAAVEFIAACDRPEARTRIGSLLGAPEDRNWIKLGYSNDPGQQFVEVIRAMGQLSSAAKDSTFWIVPMAYGAGGAAYIAEVTDALGEAGLDGTVISEYLSKDDVLRLSVACDIMVNLRTTDGFNNSMCESLLAGRIVLNGAWLPYGALRTHRVHTVEVPTLSHAAGCLGDVLGNIEQWNASCALNPGRMHKLVSSRMVAGAWRELYA